MRGRFLKSGRISLLLSGLCLQLLIQAISGFIAWRLGIDNQTNMEEAQRILSHPIFIGVMVVIFFPIIEEGINRYLLFLWPYRKLQRFAFFQRNRGWLVCAGVSSLLFAVFHGEIFFYPYFLIGLIYCFVATKGNLLTSIGLHMANNACFYLITLWSMS